MRFGLRLPHFGPEAGPRTIRAAAALAESDGWHSVWVSDRVAVPHARPGELSFLDSYVQTFEALVTLAHVAAQTQRVMLGTSAIVVPQRQVMLLARQVASLDALSGGRLIFGVAGGWAQAEFEAAGAASHFGTRGRFLDEAIAALRLLWSTSPAAFDGQSLRFPSVDFAPRPARPIPILVAGNSAAAQRRAARLGDGWNPTALDPRQTAAGLAQIRRWREGLADVDRPPGFMLVCSLRFGSDTREALARLRLYADIPVDLMICAFPERPLQTARAFGREILPQFSA
ncbi:MAG TPA: TIGR03619 family F420-dependent LLM class oxidoreductase [Chloroflexota bacterium]